MGMFLLGSLRLISQESDCAQRDLPDDRGGRHQIAKAQAGSLLGLGLGGRVLPISGCQRHTEPDLSYDQPDDGQTEHGGPDSEDAANEVVCFHGPTLAPAVPKVLIERNHSAIDRSDERPKPVNFCGYPGTISDPDRRRREDHDHSPKCNSDDIASGVGLNFGGANTVHLEACRKQLGGLLQPLEGSSKVTACVRRQCGFVEVYAGTPSQFRSESI